MTYGGIGDDAAASVRQTTDGGYIVAGYTTSFGAGSADFWLVKTDVSGNMVWDQPFGGNGTDVAEFVQQTTDGGYIVAGYTTSFGAGSYDFWLVKTDVSGNMVWNQTYGGGDRDLAYSVRQTTDGGYIVAGYTKSFGAGSYDFWLVKTDVSGNMIWNQTYGGAYGDLGGPAQQTTDGGYIMAGCTYSFGVGSGDVWLVKTDVSGNMVWNRTYGGAEFSTTCCVQQTTDSGYIMAGCTYSFGNDNGTADVWLVKTDVSGNMVWNRTYGGALDDEAACVRQTTDGGYVAAGYTKSFGAGLADFWLVKVAPESQLGKILVDKVTVPAGSLQSFDFTTDAGGAFSLTDAAAPWDSGWIVPGTYTVTELAEAGWDLTSIGFSDADSTSAGAVATVRVAAGETVTVTFTNTQRAREHHVAISNVSTSKTVVGQGFSTSINVTVADPGSYPETFNVTARADAVGINDGLVGYWSFDQGNGTTAYDSSGNHNDGTIYGATWTDGKFGKALSFDGINDSVVIPGSASLQISDAITIAAWVKLEQVPAEAYGFIIGGGYSYVAYAYVADPAGVRFNFGRESGGVGDDLQQENWKTYGIDLPYLPYNQSYYVVWMYDSSGYTTIYVNGNLYANTTLMSGKMDIFDGKVTINDDAKLHKGIVDEVRIYNRTLNQQEVRAVAGSGAIQTQIVSLTSGDSTTITFTWNTIGFAKGNYTITAYAWPVPNETDTTDNNLTDGWIIVAMAGDITGLTPGVPDGIVDIFDLFTVAKSYGSGPGDPKWNPNADINGDNIINIFDLFTVAKHYGETNP
jgi:plastocyanin